METKKATRKTKKSEKQVELLNLLENDARRGIKDLAEMLEESENEIGSQMTELEKQKVICGYHTLINWDKTSNERVTALIQVSVTPQRGKGFDKIAERIYRFSEVRSVYLMSGGYDFTVIVEGSTMKEVAMFVGKRLAPLESVTATATHFILKKYKDYGTVLEPDEKGGRMAVTL
ncbi:MAG: Lrp/AsnC family transcriptional regulator [Eubacteriales bacterium]|nr:Lrp/AsnC family transcriptional regulator [Eubacteriales bacterium]